MDATAIKQVINWAETAGRKNALVFHTDNNDHLYANNDTCTAYYDEANNIVVCLRTNANPIRSTMNQPKYEIYTLQPEHLTGISFLLDIKDINKVVSSMDFEQEDVDRVVLAMASSAQATTYQRDKNGKFKDPESNRIRGVSLGIAPPSPEIPPVEEEVITGSEGSTGDGSTESEGSTGEGTSGSEGSTGEGEGSTG